MSRQQAVEILETDKALTGRQLWHYHGIHPKLLTGLGRREVTLSPRHGWTDRPITVQFYGLRQSDLDRLRVTDLRHLAGIAKIRHRLAVPADNWSVVSHGRRSRQEQGLRTDTDFLPDAEYVDAAGLIAVEFDASTYTTSRVREKLAAFGTHYDGVVWGTVSKSRQARLKSKAIDWRARVQFLDATWWMH